MARPIHPISKDCMLDELTIFAVPCTQTSIDTCSEQSLKPTSPLFASPDLIKFNIPSEGGQYLDMSSIHLVLNVQIVDKDNKALTSASKVALANNFMHTLFQKVDVNLNGVQVSPAMNTYPYKAYLQTLFGYRRSAKTNFLSIVPWLKDKTGEMDKPNYDRNAMFNLSKSFEVGGHLMCDLFMQDKFMISTVDVEIALLRQDSRFSLVAEDDSVYTINILDATLYYTKYQVADVLLEAHTLALQKGTAKYPIVRTEVKAWPVTGQVMYCSIDNAYHGELPRRLIIGMVDEDAYNGHVQKNPFNFKHNSIKSMSAYYNGKLYPSKPYKMDFVVGKTALKPYWDLFAHTGQLKDKNPTLDVTFNDYLDGYTLFAHNFAPDLSDASDSHVNLLKRGNIRLEFEFTTKLPNPIVIILFAEFDTVIEIDSSNNVHKSF